MGFFFNRSKPAVADPNPVAPPETPNAEALENVEAAPAEVFPAPETAPDAAPASPGEFAEIVADFESEFAQTSPVADSAPIIEPVEETQDLEEWSESLPATLTPVLAPDTVLDSPEGGFRIEELLETRGEENIYLARRRDAPTEPQTSESVRLREAGGAAGERLARETMWRAQWDATARIAMLPRLVEGFKNGETSYLATEMPAPQPTLNQFFVAHEGLESRSEAESAAFLGETLLILTQVAAFLVRLHGAGFAHLGLRPDVVVQGKPVQILDCSFAAPLDEALPAPLSFAGYSAPELSRRGKVDARSDIYAVGAMLYRAVTGSDLSESGADFSTWQPRVVMAGVPQLLRRCLGEVETRFNSAEELHRALVKLKNRLRPALSYAIAGLSTIGLEPSRSTNQDAFGFLSGAWESDTGPASWAAFCVADGMGGMAAGEVASEVAVNTFLRAAALWCADAATLSCAPPTAAVQAQLVKDWAALANEAVVEALEARHARGGCTLDAGFVIERRLCIAHVGDARMYLLRGGEFEVLSRDHSFVMSLLLQGEITFDDIRTHSDRNKITRSLGERHPQPDYFVDTLQVAKNAPALELGAGDVLLACSDGLWEPVVEAEMLAAVAGGDLQVAARELLRLALQRGAPDNATLILLRLDEGAAPVFA